MIDALLLATMHGSSRISDAQRTVNSRLELSLLKVDLVEGLWKEQPLRMRKGMWTEALAGDDRIGCSRKESLKGAGGKAEEEAMLRM